MANPTLNPVFTSSGELLNVAFDADAVRTSRHPDWMVKNAAGEILHAHAVGEVDSKHFVIAYSDIIDATKQVIISAFSRGFRSTIVPGQECQPAGYVAAGTFTPTPV